MPNFSRLTVLSFAALVSAVSLGSTPARADLCDGTWRIVGHQQMQCYYLPTVSNGSVTGLSLKRNFRPAPGAVIGGMPIHHGPHYR